MQKHTTAMNRFILQNATAAGIPSKKAEKTAHKNQGIAAGANKTCGACNTSAKGHISKPYIGSYMGATNDLVIT